MTQVAQVRSLLPDGKAKIGVERQSACAHNCNECAGCEQLVVKQDMTVVAENRIGARQGDIVLVESDNAGILGAAVAVYIVPFFLFFVGYFSGSALGLGEGICAAIAVAGFVLGIMIARRVDQHMKKKGTLRFTITEIRKSCSDM
ncbi:hypothetical protein SDC9_67589 [bioreactor metagenome]|uniref:Protein RseC n=1 Tax=bioreactor metagenome TaxID=1076179 RepID=A0A644XY06_9ZZZZ